MNKEYKEFCSKVFKIETEQENLKNIVNNGDYEKFLKFQKSFRNYSFNNMVLIFSQYPEATKIAR